MTEQIHEYYKKTKEYLKFLSERQLLIGNKGSRGNARENNVNVLLAPILPSTYTLSKSTIIDSWGNSTGEFDLVISSTHGAPTIIETELTYPTIAENVVGVIEIKSIVNEASFEEYSNKLEQLSKLKRIFKPTDLEIRQSFLASMCMQGFARLAGQSDGAIRTEEQIREPLVIGGLESGTGDRPLSAINSMLFGYSGPHIETLLGYHEKFSRKPDIVIVLDTGSFFWDSEKKKYINFFPSGEHNDLEIALVVRSVTKWMDVASRDRLFMKSDLNSYLFDDLELHMKHMG